MSSRKSGQDNKKKSGNSSQRDQSNSNSSSTRPPSTSQSNTSRGSSARSHSSASTPHRGGHSGAGPSSSIPSSQELPRSVRSAPPELRLAIRRRQNNESARRSRERKKEEEADMRKKFDDNIERIQRLEKQVDDLANLIALQKSMQKKHDRKPDDPDGSSGLGFLGDPF